MKTFADMVKEHGGKQAVAALFGVSRSAVNKWCMSNRVPATKAALIGEAFKVDPQILRPDVFPNSLLGGRK